MNTTPGKLFVVSAPSGAGKTSLVKALIQAMPEEGVSISHTTRPRRPEEKDGVNYHFVSEATFRTMQAAGEFLESATVFGNLYGTSKAEVSRITARGQHVILEIDWQGARQVRESMPDCTTIFILPPSRAELERRLRGRRTDSDAVIDRRLADALGDMSHWDEFDYVIVNDDLERAVRELERVLAGEDGDCSTSNPGLVQRIRNILV